MAGKKKTKRIKKEKYQTEEQLEIKRFIRILIILIVLVLGVYLFTRLFVTKDLLNKEKEQETITPGVINYDVTTIGAMFNKAEKEYYVIMYDSKDLNAIYYSGLISTYKRNKAALKIYFADLNSEFNKKYINKEEININTEDLTQFKVGNLALLKIKNNKVIKALSNEEDVSKELEYIKSIES